MEDVLIRDREAILEVEESGDEDGAVSLAAQRRRRGHHLDGLQGHRLHNSARRVEERGRAVGKRAAFCPPATGRIAFARRLSEKCLVVDIRANGQ
jgi:hypothetical protein